MEPVWDGDVELHEGRYWNVSLCTVVGGSGGVAGSVVVDGTDGASSGGAVGGDFGNSNGETEYWWKSIVWEWFLAQVVEILSW